MTHLNSKKEKFFYYICVNAMDIICHMNFSIMALSMLLINSGLKIKAVSISGSYTGGKMGVFISILHQVLDMLKLLALKFFQFQITVT